MYLMIDNYDSFVYNLRAYFEELGKEIIVKRSDRITMDFRAGFLFLESVWDTRFWGSVPGQL